MAGEVIIGRKVTLYISRDAGYVPVACATGCSIEVDAEEIETTTVDSGRDRDYVGGMRDASLTVEGIVTLDETPSFQFDELVDLVGETEVLLITFTNSFGDLLSYQMTVLITSVHADAPVTGFNSFSAEFKRCGAWVKNKTYNGLVLDSTGNPIKDSQGYYIRG